MKLRGILAGLIVAAATLLAPPQQAHAQSCNAPDGVGSFDVFVNVDVGEPVIYNNLSKAQLGTTNFHGRIAQVLSTARTGLQLQWRYNYQVIRSRNRYCFWVNDITIDISYHQLDVNIASEYQPGSCQYSAILDHELEHVDVAQRVLSPYVQQIRQALTTLSIPTPHLPSLANSPEDARAAVEDVFRRTLLPVRDHMSRVLNEQQAHVDTIDNYRRTWRRCRKW